MARKSKKTKIDKYIESLHRIDNKTVIITGANSGIGFEIARTALIKGAKVVMACRSLERAQAAKEKLILETGSINVVIEQYNQADISSIHSFTNIIKNKYQDFYALVLNAGIFMPKDALDEFRISNSYKTNFLGALILMSDLQEFLDNSELERRIIVQGSVVARMNKYKNKDHLIYGEDALVKQYNLSKLCVCNLYTYYRDRNSNPNIKYLLCEPGVAFTNIIRDFKKWFKKIAVPFVRTFACSAREGSLSACKLLCDLAANGDFYHPRGFISVKGLPKKDVFPKKYINHQIITDGEEIVKIYARQ